MSKQILPVLVGLAFSIASTVALAQEDYPKGDIVTGKKLYESDGCWQCHGYVAQGGNAGPKLNPPPTFPVFLLQLRTPRLVMPPYAASVLSDNQAADIHAYLMTFPKPADPKTIKLLQ